MAIRTTQKRFQKKVRASCSIARGCLWSKAQLKQIKDSCQAIWGSDHEIIWTEWKITLREESHFFWSEQDDCHNWPNFFKSKRPPTQKSTLESEAEAHGWKKTLMQSWKQFHAHTSINYMKRVWSARLQGIHMSDAFRCSNISASMGLKSFCPWCLKLGGNTEMTAIHLKECIIGWQLCDICQHEYTEHPGPPFWM